MYSTRLYKTLVVLIAMVLTHGIVTASIFALNASPNAAVTGQTANRASLWPTAKPVPGTAAGAQAQTPTGTAAGAPQLSRAADALSFMNIGTAAPSLAVIPPASAPAAASPAAATLTVDRKAAAESTHPLAIIYLPGLDFNSINIQNAPHIYQLISDSAVANLSAPLPGGREQLLSNPHIAWYSLPDNLSLAAVDASLPEAMSTFDERWLVVLVSDPYLKAKSTAPPSRALTSVVIHGNDLKGYLTSESSHRQGLICANDLDLLARHLNFEPDDPNYSDASIEGLETLDNTATRLGNLAQERQVIQSTYDSKTIGGLGFMSLFFVALGISCILIYLNYRGRIAFRRVLIPLVRVIWIVVLSFPAASFLMFLFVPPMPSSQTMLGLCGIWMFVITVGALILGKIRKWVYSIIALFILSILVIVVGQLCGGPLAMPGYMTYDILEGSRYYGMGNEQGAMLFGSWITLTGLLINRFGDLRGVRALKLWGFPLGSAALLIMSSSPWLGASFGQLIWGTTGCFVAWWLFNNRRINPLFIAISVVASFTVAVGVLYLDVMLNPLSHMSWVIPAMEQGFPNLAIALLHEVWKVSLNTMTAHVPAVALVFAAAIVIFLIVLLIRKPGTYREFWQRNPAFRSAYGVCLFISLIAFCLEDSGVFTPAVLLIYPVSCLIWLIADLHRWHLRTLAAGDEEPSIRQMQQEAIAKETSTHAAALNRPPQPTAAVLAQEEQRSETTASMIDQSLQVILGSSATATADPAAGSAATTGGKRQAEFELRAKAELSAAIRAATELDTRLKATAGRPAEATVQAAITVADGGEAKTAGGQNSGHEISTIVDEILKSAGSKEPTESEAASKDAETTGDEKSALIANPDDLLPSAAASADQQPSVRRSTALMSMITLVSRVTGFARTWAMAFALGNTLLTSAYNIANGLPNQIFELVAGGILSSVFLPIYLAQREKRGKQAASDYASNLFSLGLVVLGAISILATVFAPQVVFTQTFLNQNSNQEAVQLACFFFRFFAIQIFFYGIGGLLNSLLNAHREFLWSSIGPVFNNIVVVAVMFSYPFLAATNPQLAMTWLAVGTSLGVVAMFAIQLPALIRLKIPLRFRINLRDPALRESLVLAVPVTVFVVINVIVASVLNAVALHTSPEGPSAIAYAWLWYQLPYGVIAVALSTALFTEMSEASAAENWTQLRANIRMGLRTTLFAIIPLALMVLVLANQLVGLYNFGKFTHDDVLVVAQVLRYWCLALPFFAAYRFIYRVFSSLRDLKAFIAIDAIGRLVQVFLYGFLTTGFGLWPGLGLVGLPLADAISYVLLCAAMLVLLYRKVGHYGLTKIFLDGLKVTLAALAAAALPFFLTALGGPDPNILVSLAKACLWGTFIMLAYFLCCRLLRVPEVALVGQLAKRFKQLARQPGGDQDGSSDDGLGDKQKGYPNGKQNGKSAGEPARKGAHEHECEDERERDRQR
ncbi:MAG: murein biosynthesis integral membrane protein MurJ [Actinomycetia bacterium]|nr:murein biosynthesis integral membrane protein MurJ [Actinomycetes bacterium]